jgi:hypothetical protein
MYSKIKLRDQLIISQIKYLRSFKLGNINTSYWFYLERESLG